MILQKKFFSKFKIDYPEDLLEYQKESFENFINKGLKKVFLEYFPIFDYSEKELRLDFVDCYLGKPKYSEEECKEKGWTYSAPLRGKLRLTNLINNESSEQDVYLGEIPILTDRCTFIINGNERIIVSQLLRSPGVYFTAIPYGERKLFGAKIIPFRGAWLEFQVEPSNILQVKIDRRKKVYATILLKAFGISLEEIKDQFKELDEGVNIIRDTLKKDDTEDTEDALLYIHLKLRSFEPNTYDNALLLFENMFRRADRYSLSEVGRYHINRRLNLSLNSLFIEKDDLIEIVKEILRLQKNPKAEPDDIDALWNRRVKGIGELLENQTRIGLIRMVKAIKDKMAVLDKTQKLVPGQVIYSKVFSNAINEFFNTSPLSQIATQINILAELEHKRRLTASGPGGLTKERAGFDVRDVHPSHYGRICPVQTPEGQNIGLITYRALYSKINEFGFLITPYYKVKEGKVNRKEIIYLSSLEEKNFKIASGTTSLNENDEIIDEYVEGRVNGEPTLIHKDEVELIDVSPIQPFSVATNLIPFLVHDDANRSQMGSNMQKQAVPLIKPEIPIISTGLEEIVAKNSGYLILAEDDGEVLEVDGSHLTVVYYRKGGKKEKKTYILKKYQRTNDFTCINQKPIVEKGQKFKKG